MPADCWPSWRQPQINADLAKGWGQLPSNSQSRNLKIEISKVGFQTLANTKGGIAQFYDRDMTEGNGRRRHEGDAAVLSAIRRNSTPCSCASKRPASASTRSKRRGAPARCSDSAGARLRSPSIFDRGPIHVSFRSAPLTRGVGTGTSRRRAVISIAPRFSSCCRAACCFACAWCTRSSAAFRSAFTTGTA